MGHFDFVQPRSLTRRIVVAAVLGAPAMARAKPPPCLPPANVLFVCPAGTVKSAIARETLKARATAAGLAVRVESRGVQPEDHVSPGLAANLRADGVDPAAEPLRKLTGADVARADIVIAFDAATQAPELRGARAWAVPSFNTDYAGATSALARHMDTLIAELQARQPADCALSR